MITVSGLELRQYTVTLEGINELRERLQLLQLRRKEIVNELKELTSQSTDMGAREDSTFTLNQNHARELDGQIKLLERIITMARITKKPKTSDTVQVGSQITVRLSGEERTYTLVGSVEADPLGGKISDESPFGKSLIGKRVKDTCEVIARDQRVTATIIRIE